MYCESTCTLYNKGVGREGNQVRQHHVCSYAWRKMEIMVAWNPTVYMVCPNSGKGVFG